MVFLPPTKKLTDPSSSIAPMQRKRTYSLKSSPENLTPTKLTGSLMKRNKRTSDSYLPDDCWEIIMRLSKINLNSLSLVSKQFLSITDRLRFSLTVKDGTRHFLPRLFKRLTNLTSLDLSHYTYPLDELLCKISSSNFPPLKLTSLKLPHASIFPANGLLAFSQSITTLTSLTCSRVFLDNNPLPLIAHCFPLLKQLNLSRPHFDSQDDHINGIHSLLSNSPYIQHLDISHTYFLNDQHVAELSLFLADLVSINLTGCWRLTESALFSLVTNCPSLTHIKMEYTTIGKEDTVGGGDSSNSCTVVGSTKLKSLSLARCQYLKDENIILFASIFPNLEVLDLSYWKDISEEIISQVLRCCSKIKYLNLSYTNVDDKSLYIISTSCCGLLKLLLEHCTDITEKGVKHVVENCTQLREINLRYCDQVQANDVALMVSSRPSLRKIIAPFAFSDRKRKVFLRRYGCLVC